MFHWLYRYLFRGIGIVFLVAVITLVYLWITQFMQMAHSSSGAGRQIHGEKR